MPLPRIPAGAIALAASAASIALLPAPVHAASLQMGIVDEALSDTRDPALLERLNTLDATLFRVNVYWNHVAPSGSARPASFDPRDPASRFYDFSAVDAVVEALAAHGVAPILTVLRAPSWAEGNSPKDRRNRKGAAGTYNPNPAELRDFAHALALRYSGTFARGIGQPALPRVSRFQAWNEPNFGQYLSSSRQSMIPRQYARMLRGFYRGVKSVNRSNIVVAAGLGPFGFNGSETDLDPQVFMRRVLCLRGRPATGLKARRTCRTPAYFDAWAQHPYTLEGTPTTKGISRDAGAMGNMPQMVKTLNRAVALGTVRPRTRKQFWVTELGWFSDPPGYVAGGNQLGVPLVRHARYLSESAYRLWRLGVRVMLWFGLRDYPAWPGGLYTSGGEYRTDEPKPAASAFRMPFYAKAGRRKTLVWTSVPTPSHGQRVAIDVLRKGRWRRVAVARSSSDGIVQRRLRRSAPAAYRARVLEGPQRGLTSASFRTTRRGAGGR